MAPSASGSAAPGRPVSDARRLRPGAQQALGFVPVAVAGGQIGSADTCKPKPRYAERQVGAPWGERSRTEFRCAPRLVSVDYRASQARGEIRASRRSAHPFTGAGRRKEEKRGDKRAAQRKRCWVNDRLKC